MIVEFFGASCTGKSSLIEQVKLKLEFSEKSPVLYDAEAVARQGRRRIVSRELSRNPLLIIWCLLNVRQAISRNGLDLMSSIGFRAQIEQVDRIQMLDEGPLKQLAFVAEHSRARGFLARSVSRPDLAVFVTCDFKERLRRMRAEERHHVRAKTDAELRDRDRAKRKWNEWICEVILGSEVLRIDTSTGQDQSAAVVSRIHALRQSDRPESIS